MAEHTPGPWTWHGHGYMDGAEGATVLMAVADYDGQSIECSGADRRLIAQAPEMYEYIAQLAMKHCHSAGQWRGPEGAGTGPHCHNECAHVSARALLATIDEQPAMATFNPNLSTMDFE